MDVEIDKLLSRKNILAFVAGIIFGGAIVGGICFRQTSLFRFERKKNAQEIHQLKKEIDEVMFPKPKIEEKEGKFYIGPVEGYSILSLVVDVHGHYDGNRFGYGVIETGGGDPALNGDIIYVVITDYTRKGVGGVFPTNINVSGITKIDWQPQGFVLNATEDYLGDGGEVAHKNVQFKADFLPEENKLVIQKIKLTPSAKTESKTKEISGRHHLWPLDTTKEILPKFEKFQSHYDEADKLTYMVVETLESEAEINKDLIYLTVSDSLDPHKLYAVFKTPMNIQTLKKINWVSRGFVLEAEENYKEGGLVKRRETSYKVEFNPVNQELIVEKLF